MQLVAFPERPGQRVRLPGDLGVDRLQACATGARLRDHLWIPEIGREDGAEEHAHCSLVGSELRPQFGIDRCHLETAVEQTLGDCALARQDVVLGVVCDLAAQERFAEISWVVGCHGYALS